MLATAASMLSRFTPSLGRLALGCVFAVSGAVALGDMGARQTAVTVQVLENTADRIVLQYDFEPFGTQAVQIERQTYVVPTLGREALLQEAGEPALPHVARSVIIPEVGNFTASVDEKASAYYELAGVDVAPSKGVIYRDQDPAQVPYVFGDVYEQDADYPGYLAKLQEPYILRDYRGVSVDVFPLQYNPMRRSLRVYTSMVVEVTRAAAPGLKLTAEARPDPGFSLAFHQLYQEQFINYEVVAGVLRYPPPTETGGMLIICNDGWLPNIQPLVDHKNAIGIPTTAVGVSTIGNNSTSIKNYIQARYNQGGLAFVLLVGDSAQVATPSASGGAADPTYAKVAGGDNYPDIIVGRFSAETPAHVDTQVLRTIEYETGQATQQAWFRRGTGLASSQGGGSLGDDGESDRQHEDNIRADLLANGYTIVDQIYDPGATAAQVSNAVNAGRGIINYTGHGSEQAWSTSTFSNSHIAQLTNDNVLPFIISVACVNGRFNWTGGVCFGEAWLRATRAGEPIGAVGAYMSSINQSWNEPMAAQDEFVDRFVAGTYVSYGALCFAGSCRMMEKYPGSTAVSMFNTWHIFGDPSLRVVGVVTPPSGIEVTPEAGFSVAGPYGGPFVPGSASYTIHNIGGSPVNYSVGKTALWLDVDNPSGQIPGGGSVTVTVSFNALANLLVNGGYGDTVTFTNLTNHVGDTARDVTLLVGVPVWVYGWNMDTNPGWGTQGEWQFGVPAGLGGSQHGHPDPTSGATGANVYGVNLQGDYSLTLGGPYYLTLGPVDLSCCSQTSLKFQRWLNSDVQPYVSATIEVSANGTDWTEVYSNGMQEVADSAWTPQAVDISAVADHQPTVYVRWGYRIGQNGGWAYSGWNIDDVEVWGLAPPPPQPDGACCLSDQSCVVTTPSNCIASYLGSFLGAGTACDLNPCVPGMCRGDCNCDQSVGFEDIDLFVASIPNNQSAWQALYSARHGGAQPPCSFANCDVNGNGHVGFDDIDPFVTRIPSACP